MPEPASSIAPSRSRISGWLTRCAGAKWLLRRFRQHVTGRMDISADRGTASFCLATGPFVEASPQSLRAYQMRRRGSSCRGSPMISCSRIAGAMGDPHAGGLLRHRSDSPEGARSQYRLRAPTGGLRRVPGKQLAFDRRHSRLAASADALITDRSSPGRCPYVAPRFRMTPVSPASRVFCTARRRSRRIPRTSRASNERRSISRGRNLLRGSDTARQFQRYDAKVWQIVP